PTPPTSTPFPYTTLFRSLPPGVVIKAAYDRSDLIERSIHTLKHTLVEEMIVVGLVCILFLLHARSELVAIFVVPTSVLASLLIRSEEHTSELQSPDHLVC